MQNNFITASAHIDELDAEITQGVDIVTQRRDNVELNNVLTNSFGFGGTNGTLVMSRYNT